MNPFDYYYLSEPVRRTRPGRIVMNLNLAAFSELFRAYESRPELAGWVSPGRWFQAAALPLHYQGLTFDQLLLRSAIVELGAVDLWYSLAKASMRLERVYEIWREKAQSKKRLGAFTLRTMWILGENGKLGAQGPDELRGRYGVVLDGVPTDHPVLRLLGAAVAEYVGAGVPVTVYLNPINVDQLARAGLGDAAGLSVTIERARTAVESAGGHFLDLHALLPNGSFRDPAGHLVLGEPEVVARALARAIAKQPGWPPPGVAR